MKRKKGAVPIGEYIHFTDEQKRRANDTDLADFLKYHGENLLPSGHDKRLSSDHSITIRGNQWYDHAADHGGYAIEFVRQFFGLSYPEAVTMLLGSSTDSYAAAHKSQPEPEKLFTLPPAHSNMRRVFAYLLKERFIDREVARFFVRQKLIYESCERFKDGSAEYHNAVFVGTDEHGVARHAHKRGLFSGSFKGNVAGSDPAYSFHYIGTGNRIYVFEAPIDLLSYITLHPQDWQQHSYVALCGLSEQAMMKMLDLYPQLNNVVLCLDNDSAGIATTRKLHGVLAEKGISCETKLSIAKDWSEDLRTYI